MSSTPEAGISATLATSGIAIVIFAARQMLGMLKIGARQPMRWTHCEVVLWLNGSVVTCDGDNRLPLLRVYCAADAS